jgi:serine/threonine-protein kinase
MAAQQAQLAHEFGQEVAQIAADARIAALVPLHDLRPEMERIRARMSRIEKHLGEVGAVAAGPGHYVLGRGHLALQRWEDAVRELESSQAAGYLSAELFYALGLAHGKLYQKGLAALVKTDDAQADAKRREAIVHAHRDPALRYLMQVRGGAESEAAPAEYLQGLIAFYDERFDEALRLAAAAAARDPSFFEARTLEGEIHVAISRDHHLKGNDDADLAELRLAGPAYRAALEVGRSSAAALSGECWRLVAIAGARASKDKSPEAPIDDALTACRRAAIARPDDATLLTAQAQAWNVMAHYQTRHGGDPIGAHREAVKLGEQALLIDPKDADTNEVLSRMYAIVAEHRLMRGGDGRDAIERAISYGRRAVELNPTAFSGYISLADVLVTRALDASRRGLDPRSSFDAVIEYATRQRRHFPGSDAALTYLQCGYVGLAQWQKDHGIDPTDALQKGNAASEEEIRGIAKPVIGLTNLCFGQWLLAGHLMRLGRDPEPVLAEAIGSCQKAVELDGNDYTAHLDLGVSESALARWRLEQGADPMPALERARAALGRSLEIDANVYTYRYIGEAELIAARWAMGHGRDPGPAFAAAEAAAQKAIAADGNDADALTHLAEIERWRAEWMVQRKRLADSLVQKGLALTARAEAQMPDVAQAFAVEGALHLLVARTSASGQAAAAARARTALDRAIAINAFLSREVRPMLDEAALLGDGIKQSV